MDLAKKVDELIKLTNSLKEELNELKGNAINTKVTELEKEMAALRNDINELRYCLMKQNAKILTLIHRLPGKKIYNYSNEYGENVTTTPANLMVNVQRKIWHRSKLFPLSTFDDLDDLDKSINDTNIQEIITAIQQLIMPQGIMKNIGLVLSSKLIADCNLEGQHKKKRLLSYTKFIDVLFQAAYADGYSLKAFLADLRLGLKTTRKRNLAHKLRINPSKRTGSKQGQYDDEYDCVSENCDDDDDRSSPTTLIKIEDTSLCG